MPQGLPGLIGFDWDSGNRDKNRIKHDVTDGECEEIFFNSPLVIIDDHKHSASEKRFVAFGLSSSGRRLIVVFTLRADLIRVISARSMNKREKEFYRKHEETS